MRLPRRLPVVAAVAACAVGLSLGPADLAHADEYNMSCFPGIGGGWGMCNESYYDDNGHLVYQHSYLYIGNSWWQLS